MTDTDAASASPLSPAWPGRSAAWSTVGVVVAAAFICTMDRLVLNLLVDPIRRELAISETQFSLLQGASFTIVNALAVLPFGLLADRSSRKFLLIGAILVWSLATVVGGLSTGFGAFFAARMFVGLGEAALWPVAVSIIADVLPSRRRGRAIGLVLLGQILGSGASLILSGVVLRLAAAHAFAGTPFLSGLAPWRVVLVLWGLLGAPVVLMLLAVREPARRRGSEAAPDFGRLRPFLRFISGSRGVLIPMYVGVGCVSVGSYALAAWAPSFFIRRFAMDAAHLGPLLGGVGILGGAFGTTLAGALADRQELVSRTERKLTFLILAVLSTLPTAMLCVAPSVGVALTIQGCALVLFPIIGTLNLIVIQDLVPNDMRGKATALLTLASSLFGATLGPTLVAAITQHVFKRNADVGYSLALVVGVAMIVATMCFVGVRRAGGAKASAS